MKRIAQLLLLILLSTGTALKEEVMEFTGKNILNLIVKDTELEKYRTDTLLIKIVPELLKNTQVYKDRIENTLKDSIDFLYKYNGQYYLMQKPISQYQNIEELKKVQQSKEYINFRQIVKKTRRLPCIFSIQRDGKILKEEVVELDVFI